MDIEQVMRDYPDLYRALQKVCPRSPSYRYFCRPGSKDRYFWTTEKINHNGRPRFVAGIYRYLKTRKQFKLIKRVGFAKRYKAKEWALDKRRKESSKKKETPTSE